MLINFKTKIVLYNKFRILFLKAILDKLKSIKELLILLYLKQKETGS